MEDYLGMVSVPAIAAVVYWVIKLVRHAVGENDKFDRFVPLIAAGLGVVCGVVCYFALPSILPSHNIVTAIVIGGASGLTATGTNQVFKQLSKKTEDKQNKEKNSE